MKKLARHLIHAAAVGSSAERGHCPLHDFAQVSRTRGSGVADGLLQDSAKLIVADLCRKIGLEDAELRELLLGARGPARTLVLRRRFPAELYLPPHNVQQLSVLERAPLLDLYILGGSFQQSEGCHHRPIVCLQGRHELPVDLLGQRHLSPFMPATRYKADLSELYERA